MGKDVETLKPSYTSYGNEKWFHHCGKQLGNSKNVKDRISTWPHHFLPGIYPEELKQKPKLVFTLSIAALFTITESYKKWTKGKQIVAYPYKGILFCHRKGWSSDMKNTLCERSQPQKVTFAQFCMYIKDPEWINCLRHNTGWWFQGLRAGDTDGWSVGRWKSLGTIIDRGGGCTTPWCH